MNKQYLTQYVEDYLDGEHYKYEALYLSKDDYEMILESLKAEQERKTGRWIEYIPEHGKCPFCGNQVDLMDGRKHSYCGECGAKMEGRNEVDTVQ